MIHVKFDKTEIPHCVTNDMNCFYDGVPSLRCAAFGMTGVREDWEWSSGRRSRPANPLLFSPTAARHSERSEESETCHW